MYNYQINILILSSDSKIEQTLTKLAIEFSSIPIKFNTARTYETSCSIDYLIIDTNFAEELTLEECLEIIEKDSKGTKKPARKTATKTTTKKVSAKAKKE